MATSGWADPDAGHRSPASLRSQFAYVGAGLALLLATAVAWPLLGRGVAGLPFMPHVTCYLGNPTLIHVNLVSDLLIGTSYVVISLTLVYLVRASRGGIPFHWMFLAFGTFIIACGGTHFMEAITLWRPIYWASAYVKVVTAVASVATAIALPVAMPTILENIQIWRTAVLRAVDLAAANRELSAANEKNQELDRLRRRFLAQAAANVGDWEWDIRNQRVRWSPEVEDMHGFQRGSFRGTFEEWVSTVHPEDIEHTQASAFAAIRNKSDYDVEYRSLRPDGTWYWVAARGAIECDGNGEPLRMIGMCMDISNRKRTEEALRKSEKLAAAGRLAATIAHEINNPLESVTNLIYLARAQATTGSRDELLELAERELQRIGHITRQTLGFYRESSSPVEVDLSEVLKSVVNVFQGKLNSRSIAVAIDASEPVLAFGVPGELRQVFANLVSNAIDASPTESKITVRLKKTGHSAQVSIADRGPGIPEPARAQIFEPFFTTKRDVGTGLGLWISRQIVESHGGTIRFRTRLTPGNSGTVFVVRLKRTEAARTTAA